jgi:hypothetical protein
MSRKRQFAGVFRLETNSRKELQKLHDYVSATGWATTPLLDTDKALYGFVDTYARKNFASAHISLYYSVKKLLKQSGVRDLRALTLKVVALNEGADVNPDDVDKLYELAGNARNL